jgi:hypothetical protein
MGTHHTAATPPLHLLKGSARRSCAHVLSNSGPAAGGKARSPGRCAARAAPAAPCSSAWTPDERAPNYLERERPADADQAAAALLLAAASTPRAAQTGACRPARSTRSSPKSAASTTWRSLASTTSSACCVRTTASHVRVPALGGVAAQPGWTRPCSAGCVEVRRRDDEGRCAAWRGGYGCGPGRPRPGACLPGRPVASSAKPTISARLWCWSSGSGVPVGFRIACRGFQQRPS